MGGFSHCSVHRLRPAAGSGAIRSTRSARLERSLARSIDRSIDAVGMVGAGQRGRKDTTTTRVCDSHSIHAMRSMTMHHPSSGGLQLASALPTDLTATPPSTPLHKPNKPYAPHDCPVRPRCAAIATPRVALNRGGDAWRVPKASAVKRFLVQRLGSSRILFFPAAGPFLSFFLSFFSILLAMHGRVDRSTLQHYGGLCSDGSMWKQSAILLFLEVARAKKNGSTLKAHGPRLSFLLSMERSHSTPPPQNQARKTKMDYLRT